MVRIVRLITKRGNGPPLPRQVFQGYKDHPDLKPYLIDLHDEFWNHGEVKILCEIAQGFGLDIDWGDYPFVTSATHLTSSVMLNIIPHYAIRDVWGVARHTRPTLVPNNSNHHNKVFDHIQRLVRSLDNSKFDSVIGLIHLS